MAAFWLLSKRGGFTIFQLIIVFITYQQILSPHFLNDKDMGLKM